MTKETDLDIRILVEEANQRFHKMKQKINTTQKTLVVSNF